MRAIIASTGIFLALLTTPTFADPVRTIHKIGNGQVASEVLNKDLTGSSPKAITFGLDQVQMQALKTATQGKVDFSGYYAIDAKDTQAKIILEKMATYQGTIFPNVPPPGFTGDPDLTNQWWIEKINAKPAWDLATGRNVVIADCDAGYYNEESDIAANLLLEHRMDTADFGDPLNIRDGNFISHGTSVVAIMAGVLDGLGTSGIAFDAKVIPLQNFNYDSSLDDLDKEEATAKCILQALKHTDVKIIVLENQTADGSSETFAGTREAVKLALEAGVVIVSAGGNNRTELKIEEENDTGSIIVGALSQGNARAGFSNYGSRVSIAAFGENLYTLSGPNGRMANFGGTSGATPQVAGAVALMLEVNPELTPDQVKSILIATRVETPGTATVGGRLDVYAAVLAAKAAERKSAEYSTMQDLRIKIAGILSSQ